MSIMINTNLMAMDAQRNLGITQDKLGKALQELSSGLRINTAADDAAGYAISQRMQAQVNGMHQGLQNAQDGVSMIQTAAGALSQTTAILQRMRELTVEASSTTLSSSDRQAIGDELVALKNEIDNIASQTQFNGLNLLTGSVSVTAGGTLTTNTMTDTGVNVTASVDANQATPTDTFALSGTGAALTITATHADGSKTAQTINVQDFSAAGSQVLDFNALGLKITLTSDGAITGAKVVDTGATNPLKGDTLTVSGNGSATYRVGANIGDDVSVSFGDMQASALGSGGVNNLSSLITDNNAVSSTTKANTLLTSLDTAINQVSAQDASLGAAQNQMQSAINSLNVSVENLSAAEAGITNADIAQVSSQLVTQQILQQAGVAVLAQANAAPQAVLKLLQ